MTLSAAGYTAPRQADYLAIIRGEFSSRLTALGYTELPDYEHDTLEGELTEIVAYLLGQQSEAGQAVYDARSRANAVGITLDNLGTIVGVTRNEATYSTATGTITGTAGTVVAAGKLIEWGGDDGAARWVLTEDVTIPAGGTVSSIWRADEKGAVVATTGDPVTIVTPVSGWTSTTFAASASTGSARESDAAYRVRQQASIQAGGSTSTAAILAAVLALDFVAGAVVVDNKTSSAVTADGITIDPYAVAVVAAPSSMTAAQQDELVAAIYGRLGGGTATSGSSSRTVTKSDGREETINYTLATDSTVSVAFTLAMLPGYAAADVESALEDLVSDYFDGLAVGATVYASPLIVLAMSVAGVANVTSVLLEGGTAPVTHLATELPTLGAFSVA
jgi:uncharacterized phage protein gp47/JayE